MNPFNTIVEEALNLGACNKISMGMGLDDLCSLLFTPQGREFCIQHDFPKSDDLRPIADNSLILNQIFRNKTKLRFHNPKDICLINSDGEIIIENPGFLHHIVLLEHSCLKLISKNYCVVSVDVSASSYLEIEEESNTMVYVHGKGNVKRKDL